ncbi:hypothetical protein FZC35_01885 [Candidatus Cytomitobacter indipagum]|uniref:Cell division protein FtsL n=1 Tax=Candidatus Cytomitobacter indipagum TaxID=2601575 RepID=A0A5C0UEI2_9PROT|nr:hypothetical protein [Candidatus Cytomitobacter indipagum]QEK38117.1 hypothetical protein FZC35_01885 [Candidatus Cytomitobacter indipagum]
MKLTNIMSAVLMVNLVVLHYQNSRIRNKISSIKINIAKQQQALSRQKIALYNLSHPVKISQLCQEFTNYRPSTVRQFIHRKPQK